MTPNAAVREGSRTVNVAVHLEEMARCQPHQPAIVWRTGRDRRGRAIYRHWTFEQLQQQSDRYAWGLLEAGVERGLRTILMVRPCPQLFALVFALFKIGAVPVLIDPGMGRDRMVDCLRAVQAGAFIGLPLAHLLRITHPGAFGSVRVAVTVGRRWFWGGHSLEAFGARPWRPFPPAATDGDDPAAIIFTTGSTGPPKGVLYLHRIFDAQVRMLREHFGIAPGEIDLPTFPLFSLFDPALGMTAVIPEMDPTQPARVDPRRIIEALHDHQVTNMFGSPALLDRVSKYGAAHGIRLPSLRRVFSAGAPAPPAVLERFSRMLAGEAEIHTPYGATEALPVASIGSREVLGETRFRSAGGAGTCVGRPLPGMEVRIIRLTDEPIDCWSEDLVLPPGQIGEIVVRGPTVTPEYCTDSRATRLAKIRHPAGDGRHTATDALWHRMGDVGWMDAAGRIWFCGRKAHRVVTADGTLFTVPCEAIFNQHSAVRRSALVGVGRPPNQQPVICIELEPEHRKTDRRSLTTELLDLAHRHDLTRNITAVLFHPAFPVDIRHNAKIFREKLAVWAEGRLR